MEYLNANYELITVSREQPVCANWIEVPEGADFAVKCDDGFIAFYGCNVMHVSMFKSDAVVWQRTPSVDDYPKGTELVIKTKKGNFRYFKSGCSGEFTGGAWHGVSIPFATLENATIVYLKEGCQAYWDNECSARLPHPFNFIAGDSANVVDNVNHPTHYASGAVECIEAIEASMSSEAFKGFLKGNVQKYMWRYEQKGGAESLEKAQWYLNLLLSRVRS